MSCNGIAKRGIADAATICGGTKTQERALQAAFDSEAPLQPGETREQLFENSRRCVELFAKLGYGQPEHPGVNDPDGVLVRRFGRLYEAMKQQGWTGRLRVTALSRESKQTDQWRSRRDGPRADSPQVVAENGIEDIVSIAGGTQAQAGELMAAYKGDASPTTKGKQSLAEDAAACLQLLAALGHPQPNDPDLAKPTSGVTRCFGRLYRAIQATGWEPQIHAAVARRAKAAPLSPLPPEEEGPPEREPMDYRNIPTFYNPHSGVDLELEMIEDWIASQEEVGLELEPDFQRGHVWDEDRQRAFVENLFRDGMAGRTVYINRGPWVWRSKTDGKLRRGSPPNGHPDVAWQGYDQHVLVDGLQRLTAVLKFMRGELAIFDGRYRKDFTGHMPRHARLRFVHGEFGDREQILRWYLDVNSTQVAHTPEEIARVRGLLEAEQAGKGKTA